jgi:hypothetical protein
MKKLLTASLLAVLSASVYAQGLVSIAESTLTITTNSVSAGKMSSTANSYYFCLLTLADATGSTTTPTLATSGTLSEFGASLSGWTDAGVYGTNAIGILGGKISAVAAIPGVAAANWAAGTTNFTIVVGWSASEGTTWAQVKNELASGVWNDMSTAAVFGYSSVGYLSPTALSPGASVFGTLPGQISTAFVLNAVPEPTTMALAALGGAAMLLIRRKK